MKLVIPILLGLTLGAPAALACKVCAADDKETADSVAKPAPSKRELCGKIVLAKSPGAVGKPGARARSTDRRGGQDVQRTQTTPPRVDLSSALK